MSGSSASTRVKTEETSAGNPTPETRNRRRMYAASVNSMSPHGDMNFVGIADACRMGAVGKLYAESIMALETSVLCPITHEVPTDPVWTVDGIMYSKAAIVQWFALGNRTSPATNLLLHSSMLVPARIVSGISTMYTDQIAKFRAVCMADAPWSCCCLYVNPLDRTHCANCNVVRKICMTCSNAFFVDTEAETPEPCLCDTCDPMCQICVMCSAVFRVNTESGCYCRHCGIGTAVYHVEDLTCNGGRTRAGTVYASTAGH